MSDPERDLPAGDRQEPAPSVADALPRAEQWWERPLVVFDTETTGVDPLEARIVQIALLAIYPDGRISPQSFQAIVNPGVPIPPEAFAVHGIDDARAQAEGVTLVDALRQVLRRLAHWNRFSPVVIYNAPFDWPLLWAELGRCELYWTDPLANARLVDPLLIERTFNGIAQGHYTHKLHQVAARYGLPAEGGFHDASFDATTTAGILRAQVERIPALRASTLEELQQDQRTWFATWRDQLNVYYATKGRPQRIAGEWPFGDRPRPA
jgi:DNA polymerase-3 subunit epsilon